MRAERLYLIAAVTVVVIAVMFSIDHSGKKYTIVTEHGSYHTDQFRICGKGIAFDTDSKKVIVLGNFNIISNLDK